MFLVVVTTRASAQVPLEPPTRFTGNSEPLFFSQAPFVTFSSTSNPSPRTLHYSPITRRCRSWVVLVQHLLFSAVVRLNDVSLVSVCLVICFTVLHFLLPPNRPQLCNLMTVQQLGSINRNIRSFPKGLALLLFCFVFSEWAN